MAQDTTSAASFAARRDVLRASTLAGLRHHPHVLARFVVGLPPFPDDSSTEPWQALRDEAAQHQDFMELPVPELPQYKAEKAMVMRQYPSLEYVVKVEDGVYLQPQRLLMAADQWAAKDADYVGCMGYSKVAGHARKFGHERFAHLLSSEYPMRAMNPAYALSRRAAQSVARNVGQLRLLGASDDASVALWMLRSTATYLDDQRLCDSACRNSTVALAARRPDGMDARRLASAAASGECSREVPWPLPYSAETDDELSRRRLQWPKALMS